MKLSAILTSCGFAVLATVAASQPRQAADAGFYDCTIIEVRLLGNDGRLSEGHTRKPALPILGSKFLVDRKTGAMSGAINNSSYAKVSVLFTPPDNSFQVTSESGGPNKHVTYLRVRDWQEGPKKAFVYAGAGPSGDGLLTGECVVKPR
jgi:hypothetical protein